MNKKNLSWEEWKKENRRKILAKVKEGESLNYFDQKTYDKILEEQQREKNRQAQVKLCNEAGVSMEAYSCCCNIWTYFEDEVYSTRILTGCPKCHRSFLA